VIPSVIVGKTRRDGAQRKEKKRKMKKKDAKVKKGRMRGAGATTLQVRKADRKRGNKAVQLQQGKEYRQSASS